MSFYLCTSAKGKLPAFSRSNSSRLILVVQQELFAKDPVNPSHEHSSRRRAKKLFPIGVRKGLVLENVVIKL